MDTASRPATKKPRRPDSRSHRTVAGRILAVVGALFLMGASVQSARWGFGEIVLADALVRLDELAGRAGGRGDAVLLREVAAIDDALQLAQRIDPGNPATAEARGGLHSLIVRESADSIPVGGQRALALGQFATAVDLRPTSPYTWANLARTRYALGLIDEAFYRALRHAIRLGPWEPEVQFAVVDMGFALWDEMPADLRPGVLAMAQNGQRRYAAQIVAIAQTRGRQAEVCVFEKLAALPACKPRVD